MNRSRPVVAVLGTLALLGFVLLASGVTSSPLVALLDRWFQAAVLSVRSPSLTAVMRAWTTLGSWPVVVGAAPSGSVVLAVRTRSWLRSLVLATAVGVTALVVYLVKIAVARPRPDAAHRLGTPATDFGFPSGHTGDGTTVWVLLGVLVASTVPRAGARRLVVVAALVLSAGIGLSRVYLGYHWPTDVLGGWLLAAAVVCASTLLARMGPPPATSVAAPPGLAAAREAG